MGTMRDTAQAFLDRVAAVELARLDLLDAEAKLRKTKVDLFRILKIESEIDLQLYVLVSAAKGIITAGEEARTETTVGVKTHRIYEGGLTGA